LRFQDRVFKSRNQEIETFPLLKNIQERIRYACIGHHLQNLLKVYSSYSKMYGS